MSDVFANVLMPEASPLPVQRFCDYMLDTYIAPDARFPPEMWAASPNESAIRTTNGAKAFHRHIKKSVGNAHPNIFCLANVLLQIQEETSYGEYVLNFCPSSRHSGSR